MKKYALILSLLSASLASNCMEKQQIIILTPEVQARISSQPHVSFSLTDEEVLHLRKVLIEKKQTIAHHTEVTNTLCDNKTPQEDPLDLVQRSENFQYLKQLKIELDKQEGPLLKQLEPKIMSVPSIMLNKFIQLYRDIEAVQQYAESELLKNETDELFMIIKNKCFQHVQDITIEINESAEVCMQLFAADCYIASERIKGKNINIF